MPSSRLHVTDPTRLASLELGAGNPKAAIPYLEAHLSDTPDDSRAWLQLAKAVRRTHGCRHAISTLRSALDKLPHSPHLWHYYSELVHKEFGASRARTVLRAALGNCPQNAALHCAAAVIEAHRCNYRAAIPLFEHAARLDPNDGVVYLKWASAEQSRRKYHLARAVYKDALQNVHMNQNVVVLLTSFAGMEAKVRNFEDARALYELAARENPKDKLVWQPWACMEEKAGNTDRARELFERAILVDPTFASCWQAWGLLEQRVGNLDAARALFERGTMADPVDPLCWQAWASLEADCGNDIEACRLCAEGAHRLTHAQRAAPLYLQWARLEEAKGEIDAARNHFRSALDRRNEKRQDIIRLLHSWAGLERRVGDIDTARKLYARALEKDARDFRTMHALAMMELDNGDAEGARNLLNRCVRVAPRDATAVRALATVECEYFAKSGGLFRAREVLKRATVLRPRHNEALKKLWASLEKRYGDEQVEQVEQGLNTHVENRGDGDKAREREMSS